MNIRWNTKAKAERESKINRDKAHEESKRIWESFVRLAKKAKRMSIPVLLSKMKKMRERTADVFKELGQDPPELMLQLFDEKIAIIQDIKDNPNIFTHTIAGGAEVQEEFWDQAGFEALDKVKRVMAGKDFAFFLVDDANHIIAMDGDEEMTVIGRVKRRSGLPYPSVTQLQNELLRRPKRD